MNNMEFIKDNTTKYIKPFTYSLIHVNIILLYLIMYVRSINTIVVTISLVILFILFLFSTKRFEDVVSNKRLLIKFVLELFLFIVYLIGATVDAFQSDGIDNLYFMVFFWGYIKCFVMLISHYIDDRKHLITNTGKSDKKYLRETITYFRTIITLVYLSSCYILGLYVSSLFAGDMYGAIIAVPALGISGIVGISTIFMIYKHSFRYC